MYDFELVIFAHIGILFTGGGFSTRILRLIGKNTGKMAVAGSYIQLISKLLECWLGYKDALIDSFLNHKGIQEKSVIFVLPRFR